MAPFHWGGRPAATKYSLWRKAARNLYEASLKSRYKPNAKSVEIIGLPSAVFTHVTTDAVPGTLTQTTFDTDSRADSAQILLTNSTGSSKVIVAAWIRGKPVKRLSDGTGTRAGGAWASPGGKGGKPSNAGGFLHDKFVDYESIAKNGELTFETGNNFVVTAAQVNQLADYYWKLNKTKKHIYTLSLVGFQSWYEPGEWYTLQIGGAGEEEYIDSTVECFDVRCSLAAGGAPYTSISFREVEENWKFDSNEVARQVAAGGFSRRVNNNVVTVAAQYYSGYADYYCDGTNDDEEIQKAIDNISVGGGVVRLTKGTFNITSSLTPYSNINMQGDGSGTVLSCAIPTAASIDQVIYSSTTLTNVSISDMLFDRTNANSAQKYIYLMKAYNVTIQNVTCLWPIYGAIHLIGSGNYIVNNYIDGESTTTGAVPQLGVLKCDSIATGASNIVSGNVIKNVMCSQSTMAISIGGDNRAGTVCSDNTITNIVALASGYSVYGIYISEDNVMVNGNNIGDIKNTVSETEACGLVIDGANIRVGNNNVYNCGADTGYANTNGNLFVDTGTDTQWAG